MTTITIDDELINNVLAVSHYSHPQEAVEKILTDYLQLNVKPITRLGMNSQSNSKSCLLMTEYPENL